VRTNIPAQLTSFVGREREIAELQQLLDDVRLLTLVGAGGIGKTRLALRLAGELGRRVQDGVWLVELAALQDPGLVPQAVAATLDVRERPDEPLQASLIEALQNQEVLLVLDNCEHLIAACAELVEPLLRTCPRLRVVATGRQPLGLAGETTWRVPSLAVPDAQGTPGADEVAASEAVRLFLDRTRSILPGFMLTDRNAATVAQICQHLDGIPLALELAAARVNGPWRPPSRCAPALTCPRMTFSIVWRGWCTNRWCSSRVRKPLPATDCSKRCGSTPRSSSNQSPRRRGYVTAIWTGISRWPSVPMHSSPAVPRARGSNCSSVSTTIFAPCCAGAWTAARSTRHLR